MATSTSYAAVADGDAYAADHLYKEAWTNASAPLKPQALMTATAMIDRYVAWPNSVITVETQALSWPRTGEVDNEGRVIDPHAMPDDLIAATCELATWCLEGNREAEGVRGIASESKAVGSLSKSVTYDKTDRAGPLPDVVLAMLGEIGGSIEGWGAGQIPVERVY